MKQTTVRSLPQAMRIIKAVRQEGFQWVREAGEAARRALKETLEAAMSNSVDAHLEALRWAEDAPADQTDGCT